MYKPTEKITAVMLERKQKEACSFAFSARSSCKDISAVYNILVSIMRKKGLNRSSTGVMIPVHAL